MRTNGAKSTGLLRPRWHDLWLHVARRAPASSDFTQLVAAYNAPGRYYHTLRHVADCLAEFDRVRGACDNPDAVELAIWFHDCVYDPRLDDNEERSALEAARVIADCGASALLPQVADLIRATAHRYDPATLDERLLTDIDLAILGRPAEQFDVYERDIRREYAHLPDDAFAAGRAKILRHFLQRTYLYSTAEFRHRYESSARENLRRSLNRLTGGGD